MREIIIGLFVIAAVLGIGLVMVALIEVYGRLLYLAPLILALAYLIGRVIL